MNKISDQSPRQNRKHALVKYADFEQLTFPSYVTASLEYYATGEGVTRGIYMLYAMSADELRESLIKLWGEYFVIGCEAANGLIVIPGYEETIPASVHRILEGTSRQGHMPHAFSFHVTVHENYA